MINEGMQVVVSDILCMSHECKQYRFPKRKNNRMKYKFMNNKNNWRITEVHRTFEMNGKLLMSSKAYKSLEKLIKSNPFPINNQK